MASQTADAVVVGGGVIGLACAEALSRAGWRVIVLERQGLASGASSACQSGIGFSPFSSEYDLQLDLAAITEYRQLAAESAPVDYRCEGALLVCEQGECAAVQSRLPELRAKGFACEWLDRQALLEAEPVLSPEVGGAALLQDVGMVSPMRLVIELARRASTRRAEVQTNTELLAIEMNAGRVTAVTTTHGRIATETLVIAAGAWSRPAGRLANLRVPVWPLKGHVLVTEPMGGWLHRYTTESSYETGVAATLSREAPTVEPGPIAPQVAAVLQPLPSGQILIGSSREFAGYDREVNRQRLGQIAQRARRLAPGIAQVRVIRSYAGLRPWTPDGRPLIGPTRQAPGIVLATGHAGEGNTRALVTGRLVAELLTGRPPMIDPTPISPDRFEMN